MRLKVNSHSCRILLLQAWIVLWPLARLEVILSRFKMLGHLGFVTFLAEYVRYQLTRSCLDRICHHHAAHCDHTGLEVLVMEATLDLG